MIENYYEKYNLKTDIQGQKKVLKSKLEYNRQFVNAYKKEIERHKNLINHSEQTTQEQVEVYYQVLANLQAQFDQITEEVTRIEEVLQQDESNPKTKENIGNLYFWIHYKEKKDKLNRDLDFLIAKDHSNETPEQFYERKAKIKSLENAKEELNQMYKTLKTPASRKSYDLEINKQSRREAEKNYVLDALGKDFHANIPDTRKNVKKHQFRWTVDLYDEPKPLLIGKTNYEKIPEINQSVYAYQYGTFKYSEYSGNCEMFADELCEVIGVTKKDAEGIEKTNFLLAPLKKFSYAKEIPIEEFERMQRQGKNPILLEDEVDLHYRRMQERLARMKRAPAENKKRKLTGKKVYQKMISATMKKATRFIKDVKYFITGKDEKDSKQSVLQNIQDKTPQKEPTELKKKVKILSLHPIDFSLSEEEKDSFANIYLSDYLIDQAIQNHANYLGSYSYRNGITKVCFNDPKDDTRMCACHFAQTNPGTITRVINHKKKDRKVGDIRSLFVALKKVQTRLIDEENKKNRSTRKLNEPDDYDGQHI